MTNNEHNINCWSFGYLHKTRLFAVFCGLFLGGMLPGLAHAVDCSDYKGDVVINEYNYIDHFIELKILDSAVNASTLTGWTLTLYSNGRTTSKNVADGYKATGSCTAVNDTYMLFNFASNEMDNSANLVLKDSAGNEIDYFQISGTATYPTDYTPSCTTFPYPTNGPLNVNSARKGILRLPDGTGNWIIGQGTGANSEQSPCGSNDALLTVIKTPGSATVGVGSGNPFVWTIKVTNGGTNGSLSNVTVTDTLPANMYLLTCPTSATCTGSVGAYTGFSRNTGTLAEGASTTITATVYVTLVGSYTNTAQATATELMPGYGVGTGTVTAAISLDHVRLNHSGSGVTCTGSPVTVYACDSVDSSGTCTANTNGLTGNVIAKNAGGTILATVPFTITAGSSSTTVSVPITTPQTVTFETSALSATPINSMTCWNGSAASCSHIYNDSGFLFDVPNYVSETLQTVNVSAVKKSDNSLACTPAFANVAKNVTFTCSYSNPASGTLPVRVNGNALNAANNPSAACDASGRAVSLSFNGSGVASTTFQYADVGSMLITATYTGSGSDAGLSMTGNDSFIGKPDYFVLSNIKQTAAPQLANPVAASAADAKFVKAGEAFTATVTALNSANNATPNFGRETTAEGVKLTQTLILPIGGVSGTLSNATIAGGSFSNGVATVTNLAWDEVGIITLTPTIADADYLGAGNVTGTTSANVGRFYPDHFTLTPGTVTPFCVAGDFTYFGQDGFSSTAFTLTAQNLASATTQNYTDSFAKLGLTSWSNFDFTAASLPAGATLSASATAPTGLWVNGVTSVTAKHQISRPIALAGETNVTIKAKPVDSDGVTLSTATAVAGSTPLRYGRVFLQNVYGSELLDLAMPLIAQYWNGSAWITNTSDSCFTGVNLSLTDPNAVDGLITSELCAWDTGSPGNSGLGCAVAGSASLQFKEPPLTGSFNLNFKATGAGNIGALDVTATVPNYLQFNWRGTGDTNPVARATFGVYKGNTKQIYFREVY